MGDFYIGVDIGGTSIKAGLIDGKGNICDRLKFPTQIGKKEDTIIDQIIEVLEEILVRNRLKIQEIQGIGLGAPGFVNPETGEVFQAANIGWDYCPLKEKLGLMLKHQVPIAVGNDANVAALGEMWLGAGAGKDSLIMVTLGTGVGGGIIIAGEVINGRNGIAGEIGHITVNMNGSPCNCGRIGCLETEASATGMKRKVSEALEIGVESRLRNPWQERGWVTSVEIADAAKEGDALALRIFEEAAYFLAFALGGIVNTVNPDKIVIGGGVSGAGELLLSPLRRWIPRFALADALQVLTIERAVLGNDAGIIGAAYIVRQ